MDPGNAGNSVSGRTCCNRGKDRSPRRHDSTKRRPTFQTEWGNWGNSIVEPFLHLLFTLQNNAITAEQFAHRCTSLPRDSRHVYLLAAEKAEYEDAVNMAKPREFNSPRTNCPAISSSSSRGNWRIWRHLPRFFGVSCGKRVSGIGRYS